MRFPLQYFPLTVFVLPIASWATTYYIAVANDHVSPEFPYISDTGNLPPESSIFGQLLNLSSVLAAITIYIRYMQVRQFVESKPRLRYQNQVCLVFGLLAAMGMSVVANFQESSLLVVHLIGATLAFGLGLCYGWLMTLISYSLYPVESHMFVCHLRLAISVVTTVSFFMCTIFTVLAHQRRNMWSSHHHWMPDDGGYEEHLVATTSEWVMAICVLIYLVTYAHEFESYALTHPQLYRRHGDDVYPVRRAEQVPVIVRASAADSAESSGDLATA